MRQPVDPDQVYRDLPPDKIPWNIETPPEALVELVRSGRVAPCKAIDLGCGAGNYAVWLAASGFDVTGVDSSPAALRFARENAEKRGVACTFILADLLGDMREVTGTFDFAFDWEVLHHIFPADRDTYAGNVYRLLNPGATYLSVSFSEADPQFGGRGKYRETPLGTVLYFSSESELETLLSPCFQLEECRTIRIRGKYGPHCAVYVLANRRG